LAFWNTTLRILKVFQSFGKRSSCHLQDRYGEWELKPWIIETKSWMLTNRGRPHGWGKEMNAIYVDVFETSQNTIREDGNCYWTPTIGEHSELYAAIFPKPKSYIISPTYLKWFISYCDTMAWHHVVISQTLHHARRSTFTRNFRILHEVQLYLSQTSYWYYCSSGNKIQISVVTSVGMMSILYSIYCGKESESWTCSMLLLGSCLSYPLTPKMEVICSSETSISLRTTLRYNTAVRTTNPTYTELIVRQVAYTRR
jgi:hypothetical protein